MMEYLLWFAAIGVAVVLYIAWVVLAMQRR